LISYMENWLTKGIVSYPLGWLTYKFRASEAG
jgi:hypothetical protein